MQIRRFGEFWEARSPAKLNLFFEILGRRADGFHDIETVMVPLGLFDRIRFAPSNDGNITLSVRHDRRLNSAVPIGRENLIVGALEMLRSQSGIGNGMAVELFKKIPSQAGLGGASGNAAAALLAGNRIWNLNWPLERLRELAASLGSDIAFFIGNGLAKCTGRGEQVHSLNYRCRLNVVVAKPPFGLSTAAIYARSVVPTQPISSTSLLRGLATGRAVSVGRSLFNRLEQCACAAESKLERLRSAFARTNPIGHQLTGSGSCWFGIYRNCKTRSAAARYLAGCLPESNIYCCQTGSLPLHQAP